MPHVASRVGVSLDSLVLALDPLVQSVHRARGVSEAMVRTVAVAERGDAPDVTERADLLLPVGFDEVETKSWIGALVNAPEDWRPVAVVIREPASVNRLEELGAAGIAIIVIDRHMRWQAMLDLAQGHINRIRLSASKPFDDGTAEVNDLFELADAISVGTGGIATIEDAAESRVLAYSASTVTADALRTQTILGRSPQPDAMRHLRRHGVIGAIRATSAVVDVPAAPELGMKRRLVVGVHGPDESFLGSIWVQEGPDGFKTDAEPVILGAGVTAARIMRHSANPGSMRGMSLHRLLGEDNGLSVVDASQHLGMSAGQQFALVAVAPRAGGKIEAGDAARLMLLHARAYSPDAEIALVNGRGYILFHISRSRADLPDWVERLLERLDVQPDGLHDYRASIAGPVDGPMGLADARQEVDLVLGATGPDLPRVTTLERSRSAVLMGQIAALLQERTDLADVRLDRLAEYGSERRIDLIGSVRAYLDAGCNVRRAADALNIHPNSLHYRLNRAEEVSGLDLSKTEDRLLTMIQLVLLGPDRTAIGSAALESAALRRS